MSNFLNDIFKKPSLLLASLALCMNMASYSQDKVIKPSLSGIVVDEYGNPLAGVIIKVEGELMELLQIQMVHSICTELWQKDQHFLLIF